MDNDKKWMYRRLQSEFLMNEYCVGVESFVTFALSHPECLLNGNIRCPCNKKKCQNKIYLDKDTVKVHLGRYGFVPNYYNWFFHGEEYIHPFYPNLNMDAPSSSSYRVAPRIAQTTFPDFFDTVEKNVNFEENPENENENFGEENSTINIVPEVPESPKHNAGSKTYSGHCHKSQAMQVHMNEPLTPLDDVTIPSQPTSREVNSMFSMVVGGPKKGRMYGCGSMASTIYPDEMARRPRGGSRSSSRGSQDTERMRAEWEAQKSVNEHLRIDLQATQTTLEVTQHENASLKDRMMILEDQVRRLVAGLPQPQPPRRFLYGRGSSSRGRALAGSSHFVDPYAAGSSYRRRWGKVLRYSPEYIPPSQDFGHDDGHGDSDNAYDNDETRSL